MKAPLPSTPSMKVDLMFEGLRYTPSLTEAVEWAAPNFYPYRFAKGEADPTGTGKATIPYLMSFDDGTLVRLKGNGASPWHVQGSDAAGYTLHRGDELIRPVSFDPRPAFMAGKNGDGTSMGLSGVDAHGDMLVVNAAPGCQFFLHKGEDGKSMRCTFCGYGRPDERMKPLGQEINEVALPDATYARLRDTLAAAMDEGAFKHVYLVGGSLTDWNEEGERFRAIAKAAREAVGHRAYITLGCGALPDNELQRFKDEDLVDGACFNLEVWSERLFNSVCPGKSHFIGWEPWLHSLRSAARIFGEGNAFTAMVGGVEMEPEHGGMSPDAAVANAMEGARTLLDNGVVPVWSIYWPLWGADHPERMRELRDYFERLNAEYDEVRTKAGVKVNTDFMCHRCAYMQLEVDMDRTK